MTAKISINLRPRPSLFWSETTKEISQLLPLPDNHQISIKKHAFIYSKPHSAPPNVLQKYRPAPEPCDKKVDFRNIKIPLYVPNGHVRTTLKQWIGTARYLYNKGVDTIHKTNKINFMKVRQEFVTYQHKDGTVNSDINDWELKVPKDIRAEALRDLVKNFDTLCERQRTGTLQSFQMKFKAKKDYRASIVINKRALKIKDNGVQLFNSYLKDTIQPGYRTRKKWFGPDKKLERLWNYSTDARLVFDRFRFWLLFPVRVEKKSVEHSGLVALDPGVRTFQTGYSTSEVFFCNDHRKDLITKWRRKMNSLRSALSLKKIAPSVFSRRYNRWSRKLEGRTTSLHWSTIEYLRKGYSTIFLPHFETQEMRVNRISRSVNRELDHLCHYKFKSKLIDKCGEYGIDLYLVDESWTSKTCSNCGKVDDNLGGSKTFKCKKCMMSIDRDVNGARNILMRNLCKKFVLKLKATNAI